MTIVFSAAARDLIVMTVDSAVTLDFADTREYTTGRKSYLFPGVGCITTWGARAGNQIGSYLDRQEVSPDQHSVDDLAILTYRYLTEEYRPHEFNLDDVGYHVAGFDRNGQPRLFHIFWGFDRPRPAEQTRQKYEKYDHSPNLKGTFFLYNGRNDLAHVVVLTLLNQVSRGTPTRFDLATPVGLVRFGDFIARFAGELTPEVGPPFLTYLISPQNQAKRIQNGGFSPIAVEEVLCKLKELGYMA